MATSSPNQTTSLMTLPRELRDEIVGYLILPEFVYTSSDKPNTEHLHFTRREAKTFVDTRIYLASRISPNVLGVCQQLRQECLQHHAHILDSSANSTAMNDTQNPDQKPPSSVLAERLGTEKDEEAERLGNHGVRITLEAGRAQRGNFGYFQPIREELSPRFLALLPLIEKAKRLRLVVWPGYDWWNGQRPRAMTRVNGRLRHVGSSNGDSQSVHPDVVSFAIGKVLERLPAVEELSLDVLVHVSEVAQWDLPDQKWDNIQYWLDGPVARTCRPTVRKVVRRLTTVWTPKLTEAFYTQEEIRSDGEKKWHVSRKGNMRTVSNPYAMIAKRFLLMALAHDRVPS
jgi:hypothetical protein